jgi:hypothetical protein
MGELQCDKCVTQLLDVKPDHCRMPHFGECAFFKRRSIVMWRGKQIDTLTQAELVTALEEAYELMEKQRQQMPPQYRVHERNA